MLKIKKARSGWIAARVPGEIHLDLMRAGQMEEPLVSTNAWECRWPEKKSWWYRMHFDATAAFLEQERQQLVFDGLDLHAQVFLNDTLIGEAKNAFVPAVFDVRHRLEKGRNDLVVRLTAGAELVDEFDNVVMTRTFSKLYALGGARLGWAYCPEAVADVLNRLRGPFNVNSAAQAAGLAALADTDFADKVRAHTRKWYDWTRQQLGGLGLEVPSKVGNFLLVRFPGDDEHNAGAANEFLKSRGIIVRLMAGYGLPDCLRITIGQENEMRALIDALAEFMG